MKGFFRRIIDSARRPVGRPAPRRPGNTGWEETESTLVEEPGGTVETGPGAGPGVDAFSPQRETRPVQAPEPLPASLQIALPDSPVNEAAEAVDRMVVPQNTPVARSAVWKEDTLPPAGKQHDHLGSKRAGQSEKDQQSASPMRSAEIVVVEPARAFLPSARLANMAPSVSLPSGLSKPQETTRPLTAAKLSRPKPPERASEMKRSPAVNFFRKPASHEAPPRVKKQTGQASPERSEAQATVEPRTQQQSGFATAAQTTQLPKAKAGNVVIQNLEVRVIAPKQPVPPPQKAPQQQRPESGAWSSSARYYLRKV